MNEEEKEFLSNITYAECIYILTPENKYCDKIKELSVLKICEIIKNLQKENETLKTKLLDILEGQKVIKEETPQYIEENYIPKQTVKDKIEEYKERKAKCNDIETKIRLDVKIRAYEELLEGSK